MGINRLSGAGRLRAAVGLAAAVAAGLCAAVLPASTAAADSAPPAGTPPTVTADSLPTWQVNGVVWSSVTVGDTVYATGSFSRARPPGTLPGAPGEVVRNNLLAYDITTGALLPFAHSLNAQGLRIEASPDGTRVVVGGDFTSVDGVARGRIAAFATATGALLPFAPAVSNRVRALAVTNTTVYAGGNFFAVNGVARTRLAAFSVATGALLAWHPTADDDEVFALVAAPDQRRVVVGGRFTTLDRQRHVGIGAVDGTTGALVPWSSQPIPAPFTAGGVHLFSYITDLVTDGTTVYAAADGEGVQWFDGRFAATLATGDLVWLDNCYGATYGLFQRGTVLYSVGHPHDCTSVGGFPDTNPRKWRRTLAETTYATGHDPNPTSYQGSSYLHQPTPSLLHWYPATDVGTYTGILQGAWSITGNTRYVAIGGEFTAVNDVPQQGLARFAVAAAAPNKVGPVPAATLTPAVMSVASGTAWVTWTGTWDMDNASLHYRVLRDGVVVHQTEATSEFWLLPKLNWLDTGLIPGTLHTYRVQVIDAFGNYVGSGTSPSVTIAGQPHLGYHPAPPAPKVPAGAARR